MLTYTETKRIHKYSHTCKALKQIYRKKVPYVFTLSETHTVLLKLSPCWPTPQTYGALLVHLWPKEPSAARPVCPCGLRYSQSSSQWAVSGKQELPQHRLQTHAVRRRSHVRSSDALGPDLVLIWFWSSTRVCALPLNLLMALIWFWSSTRVCALPLNLLTKACSPHSSASTILLYYLLLFSTGVLEIAVYLGR